MKSIQADAWYTAVTVPMPGSFRLGKHVFFLGAIAIGLAASWALGQGKATWEGRLLASAITVTAFTPMWLWLSGLDRGAPLLAFLGMIYSIYYALPVFFLQDYTAGISAASIPNFMMNRSLVLALAGLVCMLIGYYGPHRRLIGAILPQFDLRWSNYRNVKFWGLTFAVCGLAVFLFCQAVLLPKAIEQLGFFGGELCGIGACMLFALQLLGVLDTPSALVLWVAIVPARILLGLSSGLAGLALFFVLMLLVFYATLTHSVPWKTLVLGLAAFVVIRPVMAPYRALTWQGGILSGLSPVAKAVAFTRLAEDVLGNQTRYDASVQYVLSRLLMSMPLTEVMRDTPDHVPYWGGATFYSILLKPIPRLLYPDKPVEDTGQTFGHRYGLLDLGDSLTSYNFPQLIELYANFGVLGVLIGMTLLGAIYRCTIEMFVHPGMGLGGVVATAYMSTKFMNLESSAGLILGGAIWSLAFIGLVHLVVDAAELGASASP